MRRRLALTVGAALLVLTASPALTSAQASGSPGWITDCPYSHSLPDDPITAPGASGSSHLHDFMGNRSTSATSTYDSMRAGSSACGTAADTAGYWIPALFSNGVKVAPGASARQKIYYRANNLTAGTKVEAFPADMRLVAGNSHALSAADSPELGKEVYWGCSDNSTGKLKTPPNCASGVVSLHVGFPNCWDGVLTHVNDTAHLTYPSGGVCPAAFPRPLIRLIERFEYPVGTSGTGVTLSSGGSWTAHGDFWNTWDQAALMRLVTNCLNANVNCGNNPA